MAVSKIANSACALLKAGLVYGIEHCSSSSEFDQHFGMLCFPEILQLEITNTLA